MRRLFSHRHLGVVVLVGVSAPGLHTIHAQDATRSLFPVSTTATERLRARAPQVRITDEKLAGVMERLIAASPTAARAFDAITRSRLPVAIGQPAALAALPDSAGGPGADERRWLLAAPEPLTGLNQSPVAWVMFRADRSRTPRGHVERAWVAVEVDSIASWNRRTGRPNADVAFEQDLLVVLAHEFVAHVGSIAATRRADDLCDDPPPARGRVLPANHRVEACSLRVENRVRRELNRGLKLRGEHALVPRRDYSLQSMRFAAAGSQR